jgi:hypothetical protein
MAAVPTAAIFDLFVSSCDSDDSVQMLYILCALSVCVGLLAACKQDHKPQVVAPPPTLLRTKDT